MRLTVVIEDSEVLDVKRLLGEYWEGEEEER